MLHHRALGGVRSQHRLTRNSPVAVNRRLAKLTPRGSKPSVDASAAATETPNNTSFNPPPSHADLVAAADKLADLKTQGAGEQEIQQQINLLKEMSAAAGTNKVDPELTNGNFKAYTLTGQNAQRSSTVITLGLMSFNRYQPNDMKVRMTRSTEPGGVFYGVRGSSSQAYVLTVPFEFVEQHSDDQEAQPTGLKGCHLALAEYNMVPGNPQRLDIQFNKVQLEPGDDSPDHLQRWLDTLLPHNKGMDPSTGVFVTDMDPHPPKAWLDYLMMIPEYQLTLGSFGSITLLKRVEY